MTLLDTLGSTLERMEQLAAGSSPLHRIDPRAKLLGALAVIVAVVSFERHQVADLLPFFLFPLLMASLARLPLGWLTSRTLLVLPFALIVGMFNPLLDHSPGLVLGGWSINGGWLSWGSIVVRSLLTASTALVLMASTGMTAVSGALGRLGCPRALVTQLHMIYRYLFVLVDEGSRMERARQLRSFDGRGREMRVAASLVGSLLLRAMDRAQRVWLAMASRGFRGFYLADDGLSWGARDSLFLSAALLLTIVFRFGQPARLLGTVLLGGAP